MEPIFFTSPAELRAWLAEHHAAARELWVGFYKKGSGRSTISYQEALDEALCFGWIDGIVKRVDEVSYMQRFTPRRASSTWSAINIKRVGELTEAGLMQPAGLAAFANRDPRKTNLYSNENRTQALDDRYEQQFRAHEPAWAFFAAQPPGYRRTATWWVMSAKKEETRLRRLAALIAESEQGRRIPSLGGTSKK